MYHPKLGVPGGRGSLLWHRRCPPSLSQLLAMLARGHPPATVGPEGGQAVESATLGRRQSATASSSSASSVSGAERAAPSKREGGPLAGGVWPQACRRLSHGPCLGRVVWTMLCGLLREYVHR